MSRRAIVVAGLSAIAIAASGCSGGSDAEAESPVDITKLRAEVTERFGTPPNEAPWYRHITAINWANDKLEIRTDLRKEDEASVETLAAICQEPLKLALEQQEEPENVDLTGRVFGVGGAFGGCA